MNPYQPYNSRERFLLALVPFLMVTLAAIIGAVVVVRLVLPVVRAIQ